MEILFVLVPLSMVLVAIAIGVFVWAVRNGQFDDLDSPAWRILVDDNPEKKNHRKHKQNHPADRTETFMGDKQE